MGIYATSQMGTLTRNPVPPSVLFPGDYKYVLGLSVAVGAVPTPGAIQTPNDDNVITEAFAVGNRSLAVTLATRPGGGGPPGCMVQITASADPGASEIDIQDAAVDADAAYLTPSSNTSYKITAWTLNGGVYTAWSEFQPESGGFITLKCIANPNGVKFSAKVMYV